MAHLVVCQKEEIFSTEPTQSVIMVSFAGFVGVGLAGRLEYETGQSVRSHSASYLIYSLLIAAMEN